MRARVLLVSTALRLRRRRAVRVLRGVAGVAGAAFVLSCVAITGAGDFVVEETAQAPGADAGGSDALTAEDSPSVVGSETSTPPPPDSGAPDAQVDANQGSCTNRADCNLQAADGCEVDLLTDGKNCGACGKACPAGVTCKTGKCIPSCAEIVTTANVWGAPATGVALGRFTNGTLDWIGCSYSGCAPATFFCTDEPTGIYFGAPSGTMRAVVDPNNAAGAAFPTTQSGCCGPANPSGLCNAPVASNNGVGNINAGDALCKAMGFASGTVVAEVVANTCPKPHATSADGSNWANNYNSVAGYGREYRCLK